MSANGVFNNGFPTPFEYGPLQGEYAGTFMDPGTGITYAAFTEPMPAPPAFTERPVTRLNEPNRALEFLTGVSYLPTPARGDLMHDPKDDYDGIILPEAFYTNVARARETSNAARDVFFERNEPLEASFNDTFWDGYVGDTFVLRPHVDTQTMADNSQFNNWLTHPVTASGDAEYERGDGVGAHFGGAMQPTFSIGAPKPGKIGAQNVTKDDFYMHLPLPVPQAAGIGKRAQWGTDRVGILDAQNYTDVQHNGAMYLPGGGVDIGKRAPCFGVDKTVADVDTYAPTLPFQTGNMAARNTTHYAKPAAGLMDFSASAEGGPRMVSAPHADAGMYAAYAPQHAKIVLDDTIFGTVAAPSAEAALKLRDTRTQSHNQRIENEYVNHTFTQPTSSSVRDTRIVRPLITLSTEFEPVSITAPVTTNTKHETYGQQRVRVDDVETHYVAAPAGPVANTRDTVMHKTHAQDMYAGGMVDSVRESAPAYTHKHLRDTVTGAHVTQSDAKYYEPRATQAPTEGNLARLEYVPVRATQTDVEWYPRATPAHVESVRSDTIGSAMHVGSDRQNAWDYEGATQPRTMATFRDVAEVKDTDTSPEKRTRVDAYYVARSAAAQPMTYGLGARGRAHVQPVTQDRPGLITAPLDFFRDALNPNLKGIERASADASYARAAAAAAPHSTMQALDAYESAYESGRD